MAFIRKRISPTRRQTPSYQLIETYRESGKVRQRVLANLGRHPTVDEALDAARGHVGMDEEFLAMCERGYNRAGRRLGSKDYDRAVTRLAKSRAELEHLEAVVSETPQRRGISDTTE